MDTDRRDNRIRAALFDIDGVIIDEGELYFADRMRRDHGVPWQKMVSFFREDFVPCLRGEKDLKESLASHIVEWEWDGTVDELLDYWFEYERLVDKRVYAEVERLRDVGIETYIASHQMNYRKSFLLREVGLETIFDGWYFSCDLGHMKTERVFFEHIVEDLDVEPEELVFWDNEWENIVVSGKMGIEAYHYHDYEQFKKQVDEIISSHISYV